MSSHSLTRGSLYGILDFALGILDFLGVRGCLFFGNSKIPRTKTRIPNLEFSNIKIFHNSCQKVITLQNKKVDFLAITPILLKNLSNSLIFFYLYLNVKLIFRGGGYNTA